MKNYFIMIILKKICFNREKYEFKDDTIKRQIKNIKKEKGI